MLTTREIIKTLYNALIQRLKKHRGNWEQNDPTADDYIKNRPFYTDDSEKVIIVPNQQITFFDNREALLALPEIIEFVVGQSYEVKWDDVNYTCVAWDFNGIGAIGNQNMIGGSIDIGEPFIISISKAEGMGIAISSTTGTHTVEVTSAKIVKIDKKYLPDDIIPDLAPVATSGSYNDLTDTPTLATVATSGNYNDLTNKPTIYNDVVRYNAGQNLTTAQKIQARANIGAASSDDITGIVKYNIEQNLTDDERKQARENIGAVSKEAINKSKDSITFIDQVNGYTYIACMRNGNFVTYAGIKSIEIITMPTKTKYVAGEYFDPSGLIISATTFDGATKEITDNFIYPTEYLTEEITSINISYIESGITHTTTVPVTVAPFDPSVQLIDFNYTANSNGTYTLTSWKGTYNGEASTEIIIPNNGLIIV